MLHHFPTRDTMLRKPRRGDGRAIRALIRNCPPLDCNTSYCYHLLASHYADTCVVAEQNRRIVGFIAAYFRPDAADTLFVWQVAVDPDQRGRAIAQLMLGALTARPECASMNFLEATIGPNNEASRALFTGFAERRAAILAEQPFFEDDSAGHEQLLRIGPLGSNQIEEEKRLANI